MIRKTNDQSQLYLSNTFCIFIVHIYEKLELIFSQKHLKKI